MAEKLFNFGVSFPEQDRLIGQVESLKSEVGETLSESKGRSSNRRAEQAKPEPERKRERVVFKKKDVPAGNGGKVKQRK